MQQTTDYDIFPCFSLNIGFGISYKLSPKEKLNPIFCEKKLEENKYFRILSVKIFTLNANGYGKCPNILNTLFYTVLA